MIRHIYQYELDFACTSASGTLSTLAKEKLNMSKLTKTMIASALAVAVAGPAAADEPYFFETFVSDKALKVKISGGNCKTTKFDFATSMLVLTNEIEVEEGFEDLFDFEQAGFWGLEGFTWAEVDSDVFGIYTT
jgi:hypothetical protein